MSKIDMYDNTNVDGLQLKCKVFTAKRKQHKCCECNCTINIGDKYSYYAGLCDGILFTEKTCMDCTSVRDNLFEFSRFKNMWEDLHEEIAYLGTAKHLTKYIKKLTPKAKEKVQTLIKKVLGKNHCIKSL